MNKPSRRTLLVIAAIVAAIVLGLNLIVEYFPSWAHAFVNIRALLSVGTSTGGGYYISRLNAFSDINRLFFKDSIIHNLFGYGLGNCEYSTFSILTSDFYNRYGHYNYRWFSHQMWFLQCGYVGILMLGLFAIYCLIWLTRSKRTYGDEFGYGTFGQILIFLIIINFIYNSSCITEVGYFAFVGLAIPFIFYKTKRISPK